MATTISNTEPPDAGKPESTTSVDAWGWMVSTWGCVLTAGRWIYAWGWEIFASIFWVTIISILVFGPKPNNPWGVIHVEPFILLVSLLSTGAFSWIFITIAAAKQGSLHPIAWAALLVISILNFAFGLGLAFQYWADSLGEPAHDLGNLLQRMHLGLLLGIKKWHPVIFIGFLSLLDSLVAFFHSSPETRRKFRWLILIIDVPTLLAMSLVIFILHEWQEKWGHLFDDLLETRPNVHDWQFYIGGVRAQAFAAGAITFQLLAANVQIVLYDITNRLGCWTVPGTQDRSS
jgi:hypothetical protein